MNNGRGRWSGHRSSESQGSGSWRGERGDQPVNHSGLNEGRGYTRNSSSRYGQGSHTRGSWHEPSSSRQTNDSNRTHRGQSQNQYHPYGRPAMNNGRGGQMHFPGGNNSGGWQRDRGGSANPSSSQSANRHRLHQEQKSFSSGFLDVKGCQSVEDLILLASGHGTLTTSNLSAFWSRFPHLMHLQGHADQRERPELKGRLESILATTVKAIDRFGEREVATTALGLAKVVSRLRSIGDDRMVGARPLFQPLLAMCNVKAKGNAFQLLANRASSISDFNAQALSNLPYAYALVGYLPSFNNGSTLLDHIASLASDRLGEFAPQGLSNLIWAFAKVKASHHRLFQQVADTVQERDLRTFQPQALSNIVWAFATAGEPNHSLYEAVGEYLVGADLGSFKPQELSNIVWAFATSGEAHSRLFKKTADAVVARDLGTFTSQNLSNVVWAFATASVHHPKLFDKVVCAAIAKRNDFNAQAVANTLWAFAATGKVPEGLFSSFASTITKLIDNCIAQHIATIAWAFAVANVKTPALFGERFVEAVCEKENEFNTEDLCQLHQWNLWQKELGSHTLLPEDLRECCRDAFTSQPVRPSGLQIDVVRELSAIGLSPEEEVLLPSGYSLDALVEVGGKRVGIEVDGPTHFIARKPTGSTLLKRRQVASIDGVQIVSVPYWEWDRLGNDSIKRQEYLSSVLGVH